jgi:hypothetical protein
LDSWTLGDVGKEEVGEDRGGRKRAEEQIVQLMVMRLVRIKKERKCLFMESVHVEHELDHLLDFFQKSKDETVF